MMINVIADFFNKVDIPLLVGENTFQTITTTDVGDVSRLVNDGVSGFVIPRGSVISLTRRLSELLCSPEKRECMGKSARSTAKKKFCLKRLAQETLDVYRKTGWRV